MSIINEALKKIEKGLQNSPQLKEALTEAKDNPAHKKRVYLLIILIVSLTLSTVIMLIRLSHKQKMQPQTSHGKKGAALATPNPSPEAPPAPAATPAASATIPLKEGEKKAPLKEVKKEAPELVLNGIFFSGQDGYALINNQIVREGDSIEGLKVTKISADTVELDNQGERVTLSTRYR